MKHAFKVDVKILNAEWDRGKGENEERSKKYFNVSGWNVEEMVMSIIKMEENLVFKNLSWFFKNLHLPDWNAFIPPPISYGIMTLS